ncbi:MAG: hypothetical protein J7J11_02520 [Desulfurococcales archaeon]|nr:hypothetical protein [Desulfurococcales archaeon]
MVTFLESVIHEVLMKYGERALYVLKAAVEVTEENSAMGKRTPGDFDSKGLIRKLREWGITYNPSQLLRLMERDYGIIETVYKSATQKWWRFTDITAVKDVIRTYEGGDDEIIDDPEHYVLNLQIEVIDVDRLLNEVKEMYSKGKLSGTEKNRIKQIVVEELPTVAKVMKEAQRYEGRYRDFIRKCSFLMKLISELLRRIKMGSMPSASKSVLGEESIGLEPTGR